MAISVLYAHLDTNPVVAVYQVAHEDFVAMQVAHRHVDVDARVVLSMFLDLSILDQQNPHQ
jgi:hypothetical protein